MTASTIFLHTNAAAKPDRRCATRVSSYGEDEADQAAEHQHGGRAHSDSRTSDQRAAAITQNVAERDLDQQEAIDDNHKSSRSRPLRERILTAAFETFMANGYANASTLDIASRAKVSKRDLYAQFGSKQAMLAACILSRAERMRMPLQLPLPQDPNNCEQR